MRRALEAIVQAGRFWLRGWYAIGALLWHPRESVRLLWSVRALAQDARALLTEMLRSGRTVETPEAGAPPVLRTRLTGLGDVMTFVEPRALTAELAARHLARVRDELRPLQAFASAIDRLQALMTVTLTLVMTSISLVSGGGRSVVERGLTAVVLSALVTLCASIVLQCALERLMRGIRARIGLE